MPSIKNPIQSVANIAEQLHTCAQAAIHKAPHDGAIKATREQFGLETKYVDLFIQFIGATNIPKMDVLGTADPYFHARLDHKLLYVSSVQCNTLTPVWNETWQVKNVPTSAALSVVLRDKDEGALTDDFIGKFETTVYPGTKEVEIQGPVGLRHSKRGTFWLKIESSPSRGDPNLLPYLFDGPIHYSRHSSPTVGALTKLRDDRLYSTWKIYIKGIPQIFGEQVQPWNRKYAAAQTIFQGPTSLAVRSGIQAGHRMLYARTVKNGFGVIQSSKDVINLLHGGTHRSSADGTVSYAHRIKPAVYTYIISTDDESLRFSETGAAFFVDFASKHALHSNCAESVRYSGEFHPRPVGGWKDFSDNLQDDEVNWELVIDNNSGTYSPDPAILPKVKEIIELNFFGFQVVALPHDDPELKASVDACRAYALSKRGVTEHELQPHVTEGEETLSHRVLMGIPPGS
ncbi:hypothetical protein PAXRUDRAFT_830632 [Paxillus rubicundulus Ve08.2h10]|uniref:C2 domain-containing protein n=1 Tax=Paxillus rubicundulus Ve08.2h10 TaxID=930991 RepID=A0A0D0DT65_9AGAM|nr:hypothetical protein PAXRUDRAFT_830632 [Paxillus rubicundulus Ve08.2h10]